MSKRTGSPSSGSLHLQRRQILALPWAALVGPAAWAQSKQAPTTPGGGRFVLVFLRGAMDGLSAFVPYADPAYYAMRPGIAIAPPDGTGTATIALDKQFGLHPALAPLQPLWRQGVMALVPAAGLPAPNRSHFDAQHAWETGQPAAHTTSGGWLNAWAQAAGRGADRAIGVGESSPEILRGPALVTLVPQGKAALRAGATAAPNMRGALQDLYAGDPQLGTAFAQGARSRSATAEQLSEADMAASPGTPGALSAEMQAANNGAGSVQGLALDAQHLATLMNGNPRLQIGFLSAGGWDTHAGQGAAKGGLANSLGRLAQTLVALRRGFSRPGDVVVVVSEFGRTSAENGTGGTDHGWGNAMLLIGERVNGGRWHGRWEGLAQDRLNERRDLPAFHDYRAVLSLVLRSTQGVSDAQLNAIFPASPYTGSALLSGDNRHLAHLMRA